MQESTLTRRGLFRAGSGAVAGGVLLGTVGSASAQSDYGGWLEDVDNYDGTVTNETGVDSVTIEVGVEGNGGPNAFGPPAILVNPGTTITWKWVAGSHNVVDEGGAFESEYLGEDTPTFEYTPEETGVFTYLCVPHESMGMKGVVEVVEGSGTAGSGSGGHSSTGSQAGQNTDAMGSSGDGGVGGLLVTGLALAFLSPALFAAFLRNQDFGEDDEWRSGERQ